MNALDRFRLWIAEQEDASDQTRTRWRIAAKIGCSESSLSRVLSGNRTPSGPIAAKIERATAGWSNGPIRTIEWYPAEAESSDEAA